MLRLTKKADYSLIALKHFALRQRESGSAVSAKDVAEECGIPLPVTSKLLQKLGKSGFLVSEFCFLSSQRPIQAPRVEKQTNLAGNNDSVPTFFSVSAAGCFPCR